jgi:hypothetical protein
MILLVVGWPDEDGEAAQESCKAGLSTLRCTGPSGDVLPVVVTALRLSNADLRAPSARLVFSGQRVLRDPMVTVKRPQVRLAAELIKLASEHHTAEDPQVTEADLAVADRIRRYLENWIVEPCRADRSAELNADAPGLATANRFVAEQLRELAQLRGTNAGRMTGQAAPLAGKEATSVLTVLRLSGEFTRPRALPTEPFASLLRTGARGAWRVAEIRRVDGAGTVPIAPEGFPDQTAVAAVIDLVIDALCSHWAIEDGWPVAGPAMPSVGSGVDPECYEIGRSLPRWLDVANVAACAADLIRGPLPAGVDDTAAFLLAASVLELVPPLLALRGLAFSCRPRTYSEQGLWHGARQVHDEYEANSAFSRPRRALTSADWNASIPYFQSHNHDLAVRSISYAAALSRVQRRRYRKRNGRSLPRKLATDVGDYLQTITEPVLRLARLEHYRWVLGKTDGHTMYGRRDDVLRYHDKLLPWDGGPTAESLPDSDKAKSVNVIVTCHRVTAAMAKDR